MIHVILALYLTAGGADGMDAARITVVAAVVSGSIVIIFIIVIVLVVLTCRCRLRKSRRRRQDWLRQQYRAEVSSV